ncbi:DUF3631 domain-containing protein [Mycobacterium sp. Z3061]|uniref:DUF3631 domain-containing protein n=1 Tax=Mycobacterium sp. Z3061 TaxID=3073562 RepID=UPI0028733F40|nr:DUF3631 domain-containing protein [Mycobacterium sp. Z3061]
MFAVAKKNIRHFGLDVSAKSVPIYESLAHQLEYFLLNGGDYHLAPNLGADVLDQIDTFIAPFLALPDEHARHIAVLWCAHCWLLDCWEHTPRLLFTSPEAGCGKTRALTLIGLFVPRAVHVADLTPAALYHSIDQAMELKGGRPTVLFDEFDTVFGSAETGRIRNEEMRRQINAGHDRNETVARKMGKSVKEFRLYTPMALAGKMSTDDVPATIRTRSVTIQMQRRRPQDKVERWNRRKHAAAAEAIRWGLQCWAELVHGYAQYYVGPDRPVLPEGIEDRDADVWEPLLAVAELAGGHWPERARVAAVAAVAADGVKTAPSPGIELLADIKTVFDRLATEVIFTTALLAELSGTDPRWRRLDGKRLARVLHDYGINQTNKDQRIGAKVTKGYRREYFEDAWTRYLPCAATSATSATDEGSGGE